MAPGPSPRLGGGGGPQGLAPVPRPTSRAGRGRGREAASGPLGNSPGTGTQVTAYQLRRHLQTRMTRDQHRAGMCGRFPAPHAGVRVRRAPGGAAHYSGLAVCGSMSACPVCSRKIRHGRAQEIERAIRAHQDRGGGILFATFTVSHDRGMPLADCWALVRFAFGEVMRGRHRQTLRDRFGVKGFIRATEVTVGANGWHPHQHVVLLVDEPWDDLDRVVELWRWLHERWAKRVEAHGGRPPSLARGVQVIPAREDNAALAQYLAAVNGGIAAEASREDGKVGRLGNRTPMQLLADHADTGEPRDWALWMEWVEGSRGRRLIEWSSGLRAELLGTEHGPTDDDLVAEHDPAEVVADITRDAWRELMQAHADVHLLVAAEHGASGIQTMLRQSALPLWLDFRGREGPPVLRRTRGIR
jgi:hypothetical protein